MSNTPKNSGHAPSFSWYPNDWARDLEEHPLEIEGAWIRIVGKLWFAEKRGTLTRTVEQWSRVLRVSPDKARELLEYIQSEKIGDVTFGNGENNALVTVACRRMVKDEKLREQNRKRQQEHRDRQGRYGEVTEEVTAPLHQLSSSSSSSSSIYPSPPPSPVGEIIKKIEIPEKPNEKECPSTDELSRARMLEKLANLCDFSNNEMAAIKRLEKNQNDNYCKHFEYAYTYTKEKYVLDGIDNPAGYFITLLINGPSLEGARCKS